MFALGIALALAGTPEAAAAPGFCPTTWQDIVDYAPGDFLEGGNRRIGLGGKGTIDSNDEITFDAYQNGVGYLGSADVDANGTTTMSGTLTQFTPMSYGTDCNDPNTLRYLIRSTVSGSSFWVLFY